MNALRVFVLLGAVALALASGCKSGAAGEHREKANDLANQSQWKQAAEEYTLSLQADPSQGELWEQVAYAHLQLKDYDKVAAAMLKFAEFKSEPVKKADAYRNIGGMYVQQGMNEKAEPMFIKALEVNAKDDQSLTWLAEMYAQRGGARAVNAVAEPEALDKALAYLDKVVALKPMDSAGYVNKRIALMKYTEYEQLQMAAAQKDAEKEKDPAKLQELRTKKDQAQAQYDKLKKQLDEVAQKLGEIAKAAQGK
jgi:tetratricopeptide (TPR) repeat protein